MDPLTPKPVLTPEEAMREYVSIQHRALEMQRRALERLVRTLDDPPPLPIRDKP